MKRRTRPPPTTSASSTSTLGSASESRASISAWIALMSPPPHEKSGRRPLSENNGRRPRKLCSLYSTGLRVRLCRAAADAPTDERSVSGGRGPGPVPVDPVIAAVRPQRCRLGERPARLPGAAELHQRAAEAEQRVVVGRRPLDDRLELLARALELVRAEVGTPERLADRRLVGFEVAGLGERDRRLVEMPVLEQLRPLLEQLVRV